MGGPDLQVDEAAFEAVAPEACLYFSDKDFDYGGSWIGNMGLFDAQGQPKPAWFAYAREAGGQP